jgi:hypothetical protein
MGAAAAPIPYMQLASTMSATCFEGWRLVAAAGLRNRCSCLRHRASGPTPMAVACCPRTTSGEIGCAGFATSGAPAGSPVAPWRPGSAPGLPMRSVRIRGACAMRSSRAVGQDRDPIDIAPPAPAPSRWHRVDPCLDDRGQCTWRDERKWRQKANVPFHLALALRDPMTRPLRSTGITPHLTTTGQSAPLRRMYFGPRGWSRLHLFPQRPEAMASGSGQ